MPLTLGPQAARPPYLPIDLLENAIDSIGDSILILDNREQIIWCNRSFSAQSGYANAELVGKPVSAVLDSTSRRQEYQPLPLETGMRDPVWSRQSTIKCRNLRTVRVEETITAMRAGGGEISHFVCALHDLTASQDALDSEWRRLGRDCLTGVTARTHLLDALDQHLAQARQDKSVLGLLFIDLDGFKAINDQHGHLAGDALLRAVGARLLGTIRSTDVVGRYGGDEFIVLLPHLARRRTGEEIGWQLVKQLGQPYKVTSDHYRLGASAGLSFFPEHGADAQSLIAEADAAMYSAKRAGGGALVRASNAAPSNDPSMQVRVVRGAVLPSVLTSASSCAPPLRNLDHLGE
jgi:diguanylate cyclase